jgi:hypothetical protein
MTASVLASMVTTRTDPPTATKPPWMPPATPTSVSLSCARTPTLPPAMTTADASMRATVPPAGAAASASLTPVALGARVLIAVRASAVFALEREPAGPPVGNPSMMCCQPPELLAPEALWSAWARVSTESVASASSLSCSQIPSVVVGFWLIEVSVPLVRFASW